MSVGDYEKIEADRRATYKRMMRSAWGSEEHKTLSREHDALADRRAAYLRQLLAKLPFRWHVAHAYTAQETATYGGADHIVVDDEVRIGRLVRHPGDALSRPARKFWGLSAVEADRLPTSVADIKIAERIVDARLDREIAEALGTRRSR